MDDACDERPEASSAERGMSHQNEILTLTRSPNEGALPTWVLEQVLKYLNAGGGWVSSVAEQCDVRFAVRVVAAANEGPVTACRVWRDETSGTVIDLAVEFVAALYAVSATMTANFPQTTDRQVKVAAHKVGDTTIIVGVGDAETEAAKRCFEELEHRAASDHISAEEASLASIFSGRQSTDARMKSLATFLDRIEWREVEFGSDRIEALELCCLGASFLACESLARSVYNYAAFREFARIYGLDNAQFDWHEVLASGRVALGAMGPELRQVAKEKLTPALMALFGVLHFVDGARDGATRTRDIFRAGMCYEAIWESASLQFQMKRADLAAKAVAAAECVGCRDLLVGGALLFDERFVPMRQRKEFDRYEERLLRVKTLFEHKNRAEEADGTKVADDSARALGNDHPWSLEDILKWQVGRTPNAVAVPQRVLDISNDALKVIIERASSVLRGSRHSRPQLRHTHVIVSGTGSDDLLGIETIRTRDAVDVILIPLSLISLIDILLELLETLGGADVGDELSPNDRRPRTPMHFQFSEAGRPIVIMATGQDVAGVFNLKEHTDEEFPTNALATALAQNSSTEQRLDALSMLRSALDFKLHSGKFDPTWNRYASAMWGALSFLVCHELTHSYLGHLETRQAAKTTGWNMLSEREWTWATEIEADAAGARLAMEMAKILESQATHDHNAVEGVMLGVLTLLSLNLLQQAWEGNGLYPPAEVRLRFIGDYAFEGYEALFAHVGHNFLSRIQQAASKTGRSELLAFSAVVSQVIEVNRTDWEFLKQARQRYAAFLPAEPKVNAT